MNPISLLLLAYTLLTLVQSILDREYYNALRIPVSAGPEEIKQAYRRLSRKYHPDRNPSSRKRFEKINVAYETLSNQGRKYLYDRLGREKMDDPNIQQEKNIALLKGANLQTKLTLTLQDLYTGKQLTGTIFKKTVCPHCLGSGAQNDYDIVRCSNCQGQGRTTKRVHVGGGYYNMMTESCPRCSGKGKIIGRKCGTCEGNRIVFGSQEFNVTVQAGLFGGEVIRFVNMGDQVQEGAPGDLFVRVVQAPHERFYREGHSLRAQITISLKQALFGFTRTLTQLDNRPLPITRTGITQPGQYIVLPGQGMPITGTDQKGDMIVKVNVAIPEYSGEQLEKLGKIFGELEQ